jgi:putative ABC transport system permease protein
VKLGFHARIMLRGLANSGFRAYMAAGSVVLAVAAITVMLALGAGAEREFQALAERSGKNTFTVKAGLLASLPGRPAGRYLSTKLTDRDVRLLTESVPGIVAVAPVMEASSKVQLGRTATFSSVRGITFDFLRLQKLAIAEGRSFEEDDAESRRPVALVGPTVARKLNDGLSMVGEEVLISGVPFEIVGQLASRGLSPDGSDEDDQVLVMLDTASRRLFNRDYYSRLIVQVREHALLETVPDPVAEILRRDHALDDEASSDFEILLPLRGNLVRQKTTALVQGLAQWTAGIALLVAGVGVLAVSYLNVRDRTGEIGLRMAIGARRRDIALLFVMEGSVLSFLGGVVGIALATSGIALSRHYTNWPVALDLRSILVPIGMSVCVGLLASVLPALKASHLLPVQALRAS